MQDSTQVNLSQLTSTSVTSILDTSTRPSHQVTTHSTTYVPLIPVRTRTDEREQGNPSYVGTYERKLITPWMEIAVGHTQAIIALNVSLKNCVKRGRETDEGGVGYESGSCYAEGET